LAALLVAGCYYDEGGPNGDTIVNIPPVPAIEVIGPETGGTADPDGGAPVALTITGKITFDRLPVTTSGLGATPSVENAADVVIEAVAHDDIVNVLATSTTNTTGDYSLGFSTDIDYYIRARSVSGTSGNVDAIYHSQTSPPIAHAASSSIVNRLSGNQVIDIHASHALPNNRAGSFAILDTVKRFRNHGEIVTAFPNLGPLDVFWGPANYRTHFLQNGAGKGVTLLTHAEVSGPFSQPSIYLVGGSYNQATSDHDEYDEAVIAHEWASFIQLTQSRDNNFGGPHSGEELLYSSAYSEGVVTAIGNSLLNDDFYADTTGYPDGGTSSISFAYYLESGVTVGTGTGYGNEFEVSRAVWDLLDGGTGSPTDSDSDPVAIDIQDFLGSFADLKNRTGTYEIVWLASLLQELVDDSHLNSADANTLMSTGYGEQFPPVGGDSAFAPEIIVGGPTVSDSLDAYGIATPNIVLGPQANGVYKLIVPTATTVTIYLANTTAGYTYHANRLDLSIHGIDREIVDTNEGYGQNKLLVTALQPGIYQLRVQHRPFSPGVSASTSFDLAVS
jgi:hypothetical protein